ncbi:MAG: NAD(P)-dependent oxidoreductase [Myxococcota bacterium]|nr:NAD(P)-dependent oxidoreductase [Myxococcota bacterium]
MKVLIADKLPSFIAERLEGAGASVLYEPSLKDDALLRTLIEFQPDSVIVRSTKITSQHIGSAKSLQLIVRAGAGVNTIDLNAASQHAVSVANCPGKNAIAVAELTLGHILNADRRIADNVAELQQGVWRKKHFSKAQGLAGRTIGVIGCGAIAREVIKRAKAFEMTVACYAPELDDELAAVLGVQRSDSVMDLAQSVSILTVHVPKMPSTTNLIDADILAALPDNAIVVNTSRGGIVDEDALKDAISTRGFRAGLDVFCDEPAVDGPWSNQLAMMDGVYGTHHIGASTEQAQTAVAEAACKTILNWVRTGEVENCVNMKTLGSAKGRLVIRHLDRVGVLANLLGYLKEANLNVQKMKNLIYSGDEAAACAHINVNGCISDELADRLRGIDAVLDVKVIDL